MTQSKTRKTKMEGSLPIPDPTLLTTQQLQREIILLRRLLFQRVKCLEEITSGKLKVIAVKFKERDRRFKQIDIDNKAAIKTALATTKEAANKTEQSFSNQLEQITTTIRVANKGYDTQINDLKIRITTLETQKKSASESWGIIALLLGLLIGAAGIAVSFIKH